jgi:hypothetical protein
MQIDIMKRFYELCPKIEDLIQNAYAVDFSDDHIKIQGGFNSNIVKKYKDSTNFTVDTNGYLEGVIQIDELNFHIVLT